MAEIVGLVASAVTLAATAHGAAKFAKALFKVTTTLKHAHKEMADIAQRLSQFSTSLQVLADILHNNETLCKPELHANTASIIKGWKFVEAELIKLLESPHTLKKFTWALKKPMVKSLLKNIEGIEKALMMELSILQLAMLVKAQVNHTLPNTPTTDPATIQRSITESVVQANRQVVESAQHEAVKDEKLFDPLHGKRAELDLRRQFTFDTATWLYHFVFGPSMLESHNESSHQPPVPDGNSDKRNAAVVLPSSDQMMPTSREMIVWGSGTEPRTVVNRLLSAWTTLSAEQIFANSMHDEEDKWTQEFLKMLQQTKDEEGTNTDSDTDEISVIDAYAEDRYHNTGRKKPGSHGIEPANRTQSSSQSNHPATPPPRHVKFRTAKENPPKYTNTSMPIPEVPSRPKSTQSAERVKRYSRSTPSPGHPQYPPPQMPASFAANATNMHSYTDSIHRQQYPMARPPASRPNPISAWSPFTHVSPAYPLQQPPPPPVSEPSALTQQSQETASASTERAIRTAIIDDPRLSRIEQLLAAQQDNLAQIKQSRAHDSEEIKSKHLSSVSEEYGKIIEGLEGLLLQKKEELQSTEADLSLERTRLAATTEEYNATTHVLEELLAQQNRELSRAKEVHYDEIKALKDRADRAVEAKEIAVGDAAAAQSAAEQANEHLNSVKFEFEAEKVRIERREAEALKTKREADEEMTKKFQRYEKLLKASQQAPEKRLEPIIHQPVRQTRLMDKYHSIEVNEFAPDASESLPALPFSPLKFFQNNARRSNSDVQYYESSRRPARERHSSFHRPSTSVQIPRSPIVPLGRADNNQESQQTLLLPARADRDSIGTSQLQHYLGRSGVFAKFDDSQDAIDGQLIPYTGESTQVVRSTLFWEPPVLPLGSELLHTMKLSGWKPLYSRKSDIGRTYFHGDQPIHSYFFEPDYTPQFLPPTCPTSQDVLMVDGALIEEHALTELNFGFKRTDTAEYELDGWLTFGDIEGLIERSFLLRENRYRAHYRKPPAVHQALSQPTTPATQTAFSEGYAPSEASSASRTSRSRHSGTERGQGDDEGFDTSHTSQPDVPDEKSVFEQSNDAERPSSVASWVNMATNPFRRSTLSGMVESNRNPYQQSRWDGPSLIDL